MIVHHASGTVAKLLCVWGEEYNYSFIYMLYCAWKEIMAIAIISSLVFLAGIRYCAVISLKQMDLHRA